MCQLSRNEKLPTRHLQTRINPDYVPMSRKHGSKGHAQITQRPQIYSVHN